jgi:hypothetical protein
VAARRLFRSSVVCLLAAIAFGASASLASADTTHPFLGEISLADGTAPQPIAVDPEGNLIVWLAGQQEIGKFDESGNPVNFTGLGTNILDGKGGFDCPTTPSDCDRVPTGGFAGADFFGTLAVAVDPSSGPAGGYIYVANTSSTKSEVEVFDSTGRFRGAIDESQASINSEGRQACALSVSPAATIFVDHCGDFTTHIDAYSPMDGNPAHDKFVGQIRSNPNSNEGSFTSLTLEGALGDANYIYAHRASVNGAINNNASYWVKYPLSELTRPAGNSVPIDFSPDHSKHGLDSGPFGGSEASQAAIDPKSHHVFLIGEEGIEEWDEQNQKIGPTFGGAHQTIAFDNSGGANDGDLYTRGFGTLSSVAVFGPPVVIPDLSYDSVTTGPASAHIEMTVDPAGAGAITDCHIEYGYTSKYEHSVPCLSGAGNEVSVDLSGLFTETTYHYKLYASNANGTNYGGDQTFHTDAVIGVEAEPVSDVTPTTATLHGKLNPAGIDTHYHFEYGIDTGYREGTPIVDAGAGAGELPVAPTQIENLAPGRTYHYRLVAENELGATYSAGATFTTPAAPSVAGVHASEVGEKGAVLHALVDPHGFETTYEFEYGTSVEYGQQVPVPEGSSGEEEGAQAVSEKIEGLQAGAEYHFRVVAENKWGKTVGGDVTFSYFPSNCPNSLVRQETGSNYLPDCRAYELVSPEDAGGIELFPGEASVSLGKNNGAAGLFSRPIFSTEAPNATGLATAPARFGFFGAVGVANGLNSPNSIIDRFVATRTNSGWVTTYPGLKGNEAVMVSRPRCNVEMSICIDLNLRDLQNGGHPDPDPYVWDISGKSLGRWPTNLSIVPNAEQVVSGLEIEGDQKPSGDFSHYVFSAQNVRFAAGGLTSAPGSVYDNDVKQRTVTVASWLPDGSPIPRDTGGEAEYMKIPAVSTDGSHILMSTVGPHGTTHLYMRVDGAVTDEVAGGAAVKFVGMSRDGATVDFTSQERMAPEDTDNSTDMFSWSEATGELTLLSQGNGNGNSDGCNTSWTESCGVQPLTPERPDLDNVIAPGNGDAYFYSPEQLDPNNPGVRNEKNLYTVHEGRPQLVATLEPGKGIDRLQISPDNRHAAFLTASRLTPYNNEGWREMYAYNVEADQLACASCLPSGAPPSISHAEPPGSNFSFGDDVMASQSGPFMSNDGRVAFATSDALVPQDTNQLIDVYEYVGSRPQLISAGTGQRDFQPGALFFPNIYTGLESFGANGVDLYFSTYDTLVSQDRNGSYVKFYDARTGGGILTHSATLPCAAADECHGSGAQTPPSSQIGTVPQLAGGNLQAKHKHKHTKSKKHHVHRVKRHHAGGEHDG